MHLALLLGDYTKPPMGPDGVFPAGRPGRSYRGGSFLRPLRFCRSADRNQDWPGARFEDLGVRPVRRIER